jgi:flagellar biosynthesis/type III secretory pathway protein FliH
MAHKFPFSGGSGVLLFDEDFDLPTRQAEPEVILPVFSAAELASARDEATQEGRDLATAEAEASSRAASSRCLAEIAAQMSAARAETATIAEESAEAIARLLLGCFATALPALSARHGAAELTALLRQLLPALRREPKIIVRINPHLVPAMTEEIHSLDADLSARVRLIPTDAVAPGDARITWDNGAASRDAASLWKQIENILAPAGLVNTRQTVKEHELAE